MEGGSAHIDGGGGGAGVAAQAPAEGGEGGGKGLPVAHAPSEGGGDGRGGGVGQAADCMGATPGVWSLKSTAADPPGGGAGGKDPPTMEGKGALPLPRGLLLALIDVVVDVVGVVVAVVVGRGRVDFGRAPPVLLTGCGAGDEGQAKPDDMVLQEMFEYNVSTSSPPTPRRAAAPACEGGVGEGPSSGPSSPGPPPPPLMAETPARPPLGVVYGLLRLICGK